MTLTSDTSRAGTAGRALTSLPLAEVRKPLFAWVGAADLALEQVKEVPGELRSLRESVESRVADATGKAGEVYDALALRGERLLTSVRRQPATQVAVAEGREAVRKAEAAAKAASTSARAGRRAVEDAAGKLG